MESKTLKMLALGLGFYSALWIGESRLASASPSEQPEAIPVSPENIPERNPEASPTPTPTPYPTATPQPTPPSDCVTQGDFNFTWFYGQNRYAMKDFFQRSGAAQTSSCLNNIVEDINAKCGQTGAYVRGFSFGPDSPTHAAYYDDCFVQNLALKFFSDFNGRDHKLGQHSNGSVCEQLTHSDLKFCPQSLGGIMGCRACGRGKVYLDSSCKVVKPSPELEICGTFTSNYQASSPVSLLWDESADLEYNTTAVQFPLNPGQSGMWYQWKASAQAPLVVYDPAHTGQITSGAQLFGHWTFGGQQLASLNPANLLGGAWDNGFLALATLDSDQNGTLENAELAPLGLWFDNNRDGVSQDGEVKAMSDTGVTKLFLKTDRTDPVTGSIWASVGFERSIDGRTVQGAAVDWFGAAGITPFDLSAKIGSTAIKTEEDRSQNDIPAASASAAGGKKVSGIWSFNFKDTAPTKAPAGYLVLSDRGEADGRIFGYSVVNKPLRLAGASADNGQTTMLFLEGIRQAQDGSSKIRFTIDQDGEQIRSEAKLSDDGTSLEGSSSVTSQDGGRFSYRWVAKKMPAAQ